MIQLTTITEKLQSDLLARNLDEADLKTRLIQFIGNYPIASVDEDCSFFLSELSRLTVNSHKISRQSEQGLKDLVNALVSLHAEKVLDRDLVLKLFRDTPPESILVRFRQMAAKGSKYAEKALEITQAKAESNYFKLAEYIPDNWFELYQDDFGKFLSQHRSAMLGRMSELIQGVPYSEDLQEQLYEKLSSKFNLPVKDLIETNDELIFKSAQIFFFFSLYGEVLEKDEKGEYIMPSPFLAKFMGIGHEQLNEEIRDSIPPEYIIPQSLAGLSPNDPIN